MLSLKTAMDIPTSRVFDVTSNVYMSNDATALSGKSLICYDIQNQ